MPTAIQKSIQRTLTDIILEHTLRIDLQQLIKKVDKNFEWESRYPKRSEYEHNLNKMEFYFFISLILIFLEDRSARGIAEKELPLFTVAQNREILYQLGRIGNAFDFETNPNRQIVIKYLLNRVTKAQKQLTLSLDIKKSQHGIKSAKKQVEDLADPIFIELKESINDLNKKVDALSDVLEKNSTEDIEKKLKDFYDLLQDIKKDLNAPPIKNDLRAAGISEALGLVIKMLFPHLP